MCVAPIPLKMDSLKWKAKKALTDAVSDIVNVPCGRCVECRRSYVNGWVLRLTNEFKAKTTNRASFITLTYADNSLYDIDNGLINDSGEYDINYSHYQLFMKRLRKSYEGKINNKIKYFAVGEYGDKSDRPHFHAIIFNADQQNVINSWPYGSVHFGEVNEATIKYTLKYAMKKVARVYKSDYREGKISRTPEKALMSKGLGESYLTDNIKNYYQNDITKNVVKENGVVQSLPRYYREKIYTEAQLQARSNLIQKEMAKNYSDEQLRENQALSRRGFEKETKKQTRRKDVGY